MKRTLLSLAILCGAPSIAVANEFEAAMQSFINENVASWAEGPLLIAAIREQNARTNRLSNETIAQLDASWRSYVGHECSVMQVEVLGNDAAKLLREKMNATGGAISEALLMDARGLNVAATSVTSDYWQGDEAKFTETYLNGINAVHFGEIELDESTQTVQGQFSMTIVDHITGKPIGALTIGIRFEDLF